MSDEHPSDDRPTGGDDASVGEAEARRIAMALDLGPALAGLGAEARGDHLSLADLEALAAARGRDPRGRGLPDHLTRCPTCLDLYGIVLDGLPAVSSESRGRFERLFAGEAAARRGDGSRWPIRRLLAAACVAALVTAGFQLRHVAIPNPPRVVGGSCRLAGGAALELGRAIPARTRLAVEAGTSLRLDDGGTAVRAERESSLSFTRSLDGHPVFHVHEGDVHVTAARQRSGMSIHVRTALGDVTVIGTEFRVTVGSEPIVIHEVRPDAPQAKAYQDRVATVAVAVTEGTVAVSTGRDRRLVSAGQSAFLRQGQPLIEVR